MTFTNNEKKLLDEVKNGTSKLLPIVPKEIGDIAYCTTDNWDVSKTKGQIIFSKVKKLVLAIVIVAAVVGFTWLSGTLVLPIAAGVIGLAVIVFIAIRKAKFEGLNQYVGTDGYVMQWFENSRDNIRNTIVYKFSDMYDLIVESTYTIVNGFYHASSEREYRFWTMIDRKSKWPTYDRKVVYGKNISFDDSDAVPINIEEMWTNYRRRIVRPAFDNNEVVYFNYFKGLVTYEIFDKYIGISKNSLIIDGKECNKENIKDLQLYNGEILIKTDKERITLKVGEIGSFTIFQELFLEFVKDNLPLRMYASIGGDAVAALNAALKEKGFDF